MKILPPGETETELISFIPAELRDLACTGLPDPKQIPALAPDPHWIRVLEQAARRVPTRHVLFLRDSRRMEILEDDSVHLIVTSPPYWTLKVYPERPGRLDHIRDYEEFLDALDEGWRQGFRVLVPGGRLIIVVGDVCLSRRRFGRYIVVPLYASIQERCRKIGFDNLAPIIWYKISNVRPEVQDGEHFLGKQQIAMRAGGVVYCLHGDHLGSVTLITDINGHRVGELRYTPYGVTRYEWGSTPTNRRYTGQRQEALLGLYDYGARFYHPVLGRFVSADPLVPEPGNPQSLNRYAYVYNNPLRYTDPSGHWVETAWDIIHIGWDIYEVYRDPDNVWNWVALAADVGAAVLPVVPGGVGLVVRGGKAAKAAVEVASHADAVARLGARAEDFAKIAHIPGADRLLEKLLSTSAPTVKGAEFELEFALKRADEMEEMGRVLEVIQGGNKAIDFVLKGNIFVNVKNYDWDGYNEFMMRRATAKLVDEARSFFKYNPSAVKYVFKGRVPDSVRQALEAAGIIVEVMP